ncbi:hypothetical protein [Rhizobium oryzicola]|uniref:Uncharacterized protein n=1 Tax=Rhizobium oryzicola TaxID=1232668 RepID=A0ABT8T301_9HYPH|nr:hypothetical protein [Rhizobium oryzicola]MDO1585120.1 hypothetical protein [Rhizobium oryzicola]
MRQLQLYSAVVLAVGAIIGSAGGSRADDRPLIWKPEKLSDTAYQTRLGLRLPGWSFASAGVDVGVQSNIPGGRVETPVKLWGKLAVEAIHTPASVVTRDIDVEINALTGGGLVTMNYTDDQILDENFKLALSRDYQIRYAGPGETWSGLDVTQAIRLSETGTGTTFVVRAGALDSFSRIGAGVGFEQSVGDHISITGNLERAAGSDPSASINARYELTW